MTEAQRLRMYADHARDKGLKRDLHPSAAAYYIASAGYEIAHALHLLVRQGETERRVKVVR